MQSMPKFNMGSTSFTSPYHHSYEHSYEPQPPQYSKKRPASEQLTRETAGLYFGARPSHLRRPFMPASHQPTPEQASPPPLTGDAKFDILDWQPAYTSCQRYFIDHAQHEAATQALCALINIRLPFQYLGHPIDTFVPASASPPYSFNFRAGGSPPHHARTGSNQPAPTFVSLIPYIKRLIVTGFDKPAILHGLFGDDYARGVMPHVDCERRNYLFAAKHGGWRFCKKQYDNGSGMGGDESLPFMKPLEHAKIEELTSAEKAWSEWLAMEDWMVGPRAPRPNEAASPSPSHGENGVSLNEDGHVSNGHGANGTQLLPNGVAEAFEEEHND